MTEPISNKTGAYLGWCPNAHALKVPSPGARAGTEQTGISDPEPPQPGTSLTTLAVDHWMTTAALVILFATFFVGGNIWWPFFVGAVLIVCLAYWYYRHILKVQ
ncbi:MAG: hypothetical protein M0R30_03680 [Methanoregula sp.]|jgi:hypothetical protein|uniref:hypothetical protein n=1 Tax=Methanoregula sp. TaxID=2052170 RepID=UPI0025CE5DC0|nr:hypothetical protein [Methanoregula sp.]MCK9630720.1 hypothetical protein [Methanoregula sp.]